MHRFEAARSAGGSPRAPSSSACAGLFAQQRCRYPSSRKRREPERHLPQRFDEDPAEAEHDDRAQIADRCAAPGSIPALRGPIGLDQEPVERDVGPRLRPRVRRSCRQAASQRPAVIDREDHAAGVGLVRELRRDTAFTTTGEARPPWRPRRRRRPTRPTGRQGSGCRARGGAPLIPAPTKPIAAPPRRRDQAAVSNLSELRDIAAGAGISGRHAGPPCRTAWPIRDSDAPPPPRCSGNTRSITVLSLPLSKQRHHHFEIVLGGAVRADDLQLLVKNVVHRDLAVVGLGAADGHHAAAARQAADRFVEEIAADVLDDEVDAALVGALQDLVDEIDFVVVDDLVGAEFLGALRASSRRSRSYRRRRRQACRSGSPPC